MEGLDGDLRAWDRSAKAGLSTQTPFSLTVHPKAEKFTNAALPCKKMNT